MRSCWPKTTGGRIQYRARDGDVGSWELVHHRRKERHLSITLEQAEHIIAAGKRKANEMGIATTIVVCLASLDYAIGKAYTAIAMNMDTANLAPYVQPGQPLYGLQVGHQPRPLVIFAGGLPLKMNGELVGGVGVSGGLPDQDGQVAATAVEGLK